MDWYLTPDAALALINDRSAEAEARRLAAAAERACPRRPRTSIRSVLRLPVRPPRRRPAT